MKTILLMLFVAILLVRCQTTPKNETANNTPDLSHPWFKAEKIHDAVWRISDHDEDNIYLLEGKDSALLIDTGIGAVDLADYIKRITSLPLIVINTHGHPDHVGSNNQFESVYAHPNEFEMIRQFTSKEMHKTMLQYMVQVPVPDSVKFNPSDSSFMTTLKPVKDGQHIELGERIIEVIYTPGHTKGSICLLDEKNKLLFTGDNIKSLVWMHMEESEPLEIYLNSLRKVQGMAIRFDSLLPGHDAPIRKDFLDEQITCVKTILDGSCEAKPYESMVGNGLSCGYKRATVAYNPKKLKI